MLGTVKFLDPFDDNFTRARALNFRPHGDQKIGKIDDLRFLRSPINNGDSIGQHSSHHDVVRSQHRRAKFTAKRNRGPAELRSQNLHVATRHTNSRPQRLKPTKVQIDRTIPDHTSTRKGNRRLTFPTQQRAKDANRCPHLADDVVGSLTQNFFSTDFYNSAGPLDLAPKLTQNREHVVDIAEIGHTRNCTRLARQ